MEGLPSTSTADHGAFRSARGHCTQRNRRGLREDGGVGGAAWPSAYQPCTWASSNHGHLSAGSQEVMEAVERGAPPAGGRAPGQPPRSSEVSPAWVHTRGPLPPSEATLGRFLPSPSLGLGRVLTVPAPPAHGLVWTESVRLSSTCPDAVPHGKCTRHGCCRVCGRCRGGGCSFARRPPHATARPCAPDARRVSSCWDYHFIIPSRCSRLLPLLVLTRVPAHGNTPDAAAGGELPGGRGLNQMTF